MFLYSLEQYLEPEDMNAMDRILRANERMCRCKYKIIFISDVMGDTWLFFFFQVQEGFYSERATYWVQAFPDQLSHVQEIPASGQNLLMVLCMYHTSSLSFMVSNIFLSKCMPHVNQCNNFQSCVLVQMIWTESL